MDSLSIFMPFYNDAGTVAYMVTDAFNYGKKLTTDLEVIAVNDGSADNTLEELHRMKVKYPDLKIIDHTTNRGYGGALISGINTTTKNWVFYTDGDAQYHLDELQNLWAFKSGNDIVNGYKLTRSDSVLRKAIGILYLYALKILFKTPIRDIDCDYRLINGNLLRSLNLTCTSGAITIELIKKLQLKTANFTEIGVNHYDRTYGQSAFFTTKNILDTFKDEIKLMKELKNSRKNK
jgi:glycosyltransferase involved in cell wall biosynthesis